MLGHVAVKIVKEEKQKVKDSEKKSFIAVIGIHQHVLMKKKS